MSQGRNLQQREEMSQILEVLEKTKDLARFSGEAYGNLP